MKYLFLLTVLLPVSLAAQITHSVGIGTYINYSKLTNLDQALDTFPEINQDISGRINASPYAEYTLGIKRFNAAVGLGLWHSGNKLSYTISAGFFSASFDSETRERSLFVPVSIGYDLIQHNNFTAGIKAKATFRYLLRMYGKASSSFLGSYSNTFEGSDLDTLDATRFFVSPGARLYAGYEIGRFTPALELGALYDMQGLSTLRSDKNKYLNLFVAFSIRYRICGNRKEESQ